jgi:RNA polymerase sigma-70 factor (ECF subfamily)
VPAEPNRSSRRYVTVEEVYRRYGEDLLRFLHGAHPHLNHQDCEDLLHAAVLGAVAHLDQWDPERGSLRLWVFGILRNEVRMDLRRRRRKAAPTLGELPDLADLQPSALAEAAGHEVARAIDEALRALPFREREALLATIRAGGEATDEDVAARIGIAPGSVAVYRQRAREKVREALARAGWDEEAKTWRRTEKARTSS